MLTDIEQNEGGYYETEAGSRIYRAKVEDDVVWFDTEDGIKTYSYWWCIIVAGMSKVMIQDLDIGPDWTELRRD